MRLLALDIKTYMIFFLLLLGILNIPHMGFGILGQVLIVIACALAIDGLIIRKREGKFKFSKSACISGLIISELLAPHQGWFVYVFASLLAILSKHLIRISKRHIFNPAGFGLFLSQVFFSSVLSWWASSPIFLLIILGLFIVYKIRRWKLILSFLIPNSLLLFSYALFRGMSLKESLFFINPYFLFFILTEPKTTPPDKKAQVFYGGLIGVLAFLALLILPRFDYSISALLSGNLLSIFFLQKRKS